MTPTEEKPTVGIRLASMLVDHFATTFALVGSIFLAAGILYLFVKQSVDSNPLRGAAPMVIFLLLFSLYFNKDAIHGRSIAKRILKLQVVDNVTGLPASPIQCFIRNLTILLWPVEVIATLISPTRRLGDRIAKTRVAFFNPELPKEKLNWKKLIIALFMGLVLMLLFFALMTTSFSNKKPEATLYAQREAPVGWVTFATYPDSTFEYSGGRGDIMHTGTFNLIGDTLFLTSADTTLGIDKVVIGKSSVEFFGEHSPKFATIGINNLTE